MTIITYTAKELALIVGVSVLVAVIVNAGPIIAIILNWMG